MKPTFLTLVVLSVAMLACSEQADTKGASDQWVKGKARSIKATFISSGRGPFGSPLLLGVRNDSAGPLPITPIRAVGWFESAGRLESDYTFGDFGEGSRMESAVFAVRGPGDRTREVEIDAKSPDITLEPGEEVNITFDFWKSGKANQDVLTKVLVIIGRDGSPQQETFLIE